ncbi:MAG: M20/M25/M40 family metallo-hydrolase [Myxococcota bacterium]
MTSSFRFVRLPRRSRLALGSVALTLAMSCSKQPTAPPPTQPPAAATTEDAVPRTLDAERMLALLEELASDEFGGRYTLHEDIRRAAEAITRRYREVGVQPASGDDFVVDYELRVGVEPGPDLSLTIDKNRRKSVSIAAEAFVPLPAGAPGKVEGPLVFVGYAIAQQGTEGMVLDELTGVDLKGAIAVVHAGSPPPSPESPEARFGRNDRRLGKKLERLQAAGAAGVVVVNPDPAATLPDISEDRPVRSHVSIPVVQLAAKEAYAKIPKIDRLRAQIDETKQSRSRALKGMRVSLNNDVTIRTIKAPNILAMVPGTELPDEIVLLGAHFDHIGTDEPGHGHCRTRDGDAICNGADDNGSGTAIVAELAMHMSDPDHRPRRTVVFALFSGEELGLLGSKALAAQIDEIEPFAGRKIVAMLNIDMVGRLRERLTVSGVGSSDGWMPMLDDIGTRGMRILYDRALTTRSDHAPFYEHQVPALFFFTELHGDYHAPGDGMEGILRDGLVSVAGLVGEIAERLANGDGITFKPATKPNEGLVPALPGDDPSTIEKEVGP